MALTIKHTFTSEKPDGNNDSLVQPSDWNANHELVGLPDDASLYLDGTGNFSEPPGGDGDSPLVPVTEGSFALDAWLSINSDEAPTMQLDVNGGINAGAYFLDGEEVSFGGGSITESTVLTVYDPVSTGEGTGPHGIHGDAKYLYVANQDDDTVGVFSLARPASPEHILDLNTGSAPHAVYLQGNYLYVACQGGFFQIFDVSNLNDIQLCSTIECSSARGIYAHGMYVYVATSAGYLWKYDVTDPYNPQIAASIELPENGHGVRVYQGFVYVAFQGGNTIGIYKEDLNSDFVGSISIGSGPFELDISGSYLYVSCQAGNALQVFNLHNPQDPILASDVGVGENPHYVRVIGGYAFVANASDGTISIIDARDPAEAVLVNVVTVQSWPHGLHVSGRYVYVACQNSDSIVVVDLTGLETTTLLAHDAKIGDLQVEKVVVNSSVVVNGTTTLDKLFAQDEVKIIHKADHTIWGAALDVNSVITENEGTAVGIRSAVKVIDGVEAAEMVSMLVSTPELDEEASVNYAFGLFIEDVEDARYENWSIYAGDGNFHFGDNTEIWEMSVDQTVTPSIQVVGTPGSTTYAYRAVMRHPAGHAYPTEQFGVANGPDTLNEDDHIRLETVPVSGWPEFDQPIIDIFRVVGGTSQGLIVSLTAGGFHLDTGGEATPKKIFIEDRTQGIVIDALGYRALYNPAPTGLILGARGFTGEGSYTSEMRLSNVYAWEDSAVSTMLQFQSEWPTNRLVILGGTAGSDEALEKMMVVSEGTTFTDDSDLTEVDVPGVALVDVQGSLYAQTVQSRVSFLTTDSSDVVISCENSDHFIINVTQNCNLSAIDLLAGQKITITFVMLEQYSVTFDDGVFLGHAPVYDPSVQEFLCAGSGVFEEVPMLVALDFNKAPRAAYTFNDPNGVAAEVALVNSVESDALIVRANQIGLDGNGISVVLLIDTDYGSTSIVSVIGTVITVALENTGGVIAASLNDVGAAINGNVDAFNLVTATPVDVGTSLINAAGTFILADGEEQLFTPYGGEILYNNDGIWIGIATGPGEGIFQFSPFVGG